MTQNWLNVDVDNLVTKYHHNNIIFLGDINHAIHPIAGQGFNLTIRDITKLTNLLSCREITDDLQKITGGFFRGRVIGNFAMITFTHVLVKMFEGDNKILKFARNQSIKYINKFRLSEKFF